MKNKHIDTQGTWKRINYLPCVYKCLIIYTHETINCHCKL